MLQVAGVLSWLLGLGFGIPGVLGIQHFARTGRWPKKADGPVRDAAETWTAIHIALNRGARGLSGHSSLAS